MKKKSSMKYAVAKVSEAVFQRGLKKDIRKRFKGSIVCKLDCNDIPGIPDLLILYKDRWASLECKKSMYAPRRPNQNYYVKKMNEMSFSRFIYPENKERVLNEMESAFRRARDSRTV